MAKTAHAFGLVAADDLLILGRDENQRIVGGLERIGEACAKPFAGMLQIALGDPVILLGADTDIKFECMVADGFLGEGDLFTGRPVSLE